MGVLLEAKNDVPEETRDAVLAKESLQDSQKKKKLKRKQTKTEIVVLKSVRAFMPQGTLVVFAFILWSVPAQFFYKEDVAEKLKSFSRTKE